jgi:hypothetical protein
MSPNLLEVFKQMSFLSSVLAGFAIAVAVQLLSLPNKKALVTATIAAFLISSALSAAATFVFVMVMIAGIGSPGFATLNGAWIARFAGGIGVIPFAALVLFLLGIALVGWIRSKVLGAITTTAAILASALVLYVLVNISAQP